MPSQALVLHLGILALAGGRDVAGKLIKGVSYSPVPLKSIAEVSQLPQDDWMSEQAGIMWGRAGRRDLEIIRALGANTVRLYGNNPANSHTNFLDEAQRLGLGVLPGMSDFPYFQQNPGGCAFLTNFDCFTQIKPQYSMNLLKGWLRPDRTYHPALRIMNILNEPDLKMPSTATSGGRADIVKMCKAVISAFDAMLDAEKDLQVTGPLINFTATFSYAICFSCQTFAGKPALGQMWQLDDAMRNPGLYGYSPKNNITDAYLKRWINSFNTQNPATDLESQFLTDYERTFPKTPVYIGEYHRVGANQVEDIGMILSIAGRSELFRGISFFEYQVAYWKTGSEMAFGMFGLTERLVDQMPYFGTTFPVYCLHPIMDTAANMFMPNALAEVYGGPGINASTLCGANPWAVPLDPSGLVAIAGQGSSEQTARFVTRILSHLGASVLHSQGLRDFVEKYAEATEGDWPKMMAELGGPLWWTQFDPDAKCLADRTADPIKVGKAIGWACSQAKTFSCASIPPLCHRSTYTTGDYVFSRMYEELGGTDPLQSCSFSGAAIFAGSALSSEWTGAHECMIGGKVPEFAAHPTTQAPARTAPTTRAATTREPQTPAAAERSTTAAPFSSTASSSPPSSPSPSSSSAPPAPVATSAATTTVAPEAQRGEQPTAGPKSGTAAAQPHSDQRPQEPAGSAVEAASGQWRPSVPWPLLLASAAAICLPMAG